MSATINEILSQPFAWENALEEAERISSEVKVLFDSNRGAVVFVGCGSTYYLAHTAAALFRRLTAYQSMAVAGGEMLLYQEDWLGTPANALNHHPLLVAISRSGKTTETLWAVEKHRASGGHVIAVTNYPDSPLARLADVTLVIATGQEESVVQTRSFTSMLVGITAIAALLGEHRALWDSMRRLPNSAARLLAKYAGQAEAVGSDLTVDRFYFLGSGIRFGIACEASLKMKEMSLSHSEPYPFLEFRHGPMSMVQQSTMLIGLLSERNRAHELAVLSEMKALGARVLTLAENDADIAFESGIPEEGAIALFLPILQLLAAHRALAKGLNPDRPNNLSAVVTLDLETLGG